MKIQMIVRAMDLREDDELIGKSATFVVSRVKTVRAGLADTVEVHVRGDGIFDLPKDFQLVVYRSVS